MDENIVKDPAITKFDLLDQVKIVYMEELGSVAKVAKRLNLPIKQVQRLVEKFRKRDARDTKYWVGLGLANYIVSGIESRKAQLNKMLRSLDNQTQPYVSSCCESAFEPYPEDDTLYAGRFKCLKCNLPCNRIKVNKLDIIRLRRALLKDMREEEWGVVELAVKMDYRRNPLPDDYQQPKIIKNTQNIVVFDRTDKNGNKEHVVEDYTALSPMDRDRLIQRLEKRIMEMEKEELEEQKRKEAAGKNIVDVPSSPESPQAPPVSSAENSQPPSESEGGAS